jgi:hypothetical protein
VVERGEMVKMFWLKMGRGLNYRGGKAVKLFDRKGRED